MNAQPKGQSSLEFTFSAMAGGALGASASWVDFSSGTAPGDFIPVAGTLVGAAAGIIISRVYRKCSDSEETRSAEHTDKSEVLETEDLIPTPLAIDPPPASVEHDIKIVEEADVLRNINHALTKLELAYSYVEMEDLELALSILNEIPQDQQSITEDVLVLQEARK